MTVSRPAGVVLQLIGAGLLLSGIFNLYMSTTAFDDGTDKGGPIFSLFMGVVLLLIGRLTKKRQTP